MMQHTTAPEHSPPRSRTWLYAALVGVGVLCLVGCASPKAAPEKSAALTGAERLEHRASSAYLKGDLAGAAKDFAMAEQVYRSLAMLDAAANVQLSLARIDLDEGHAERARARITHVLSLSAQPWSALSSTTRLLANGRAAALSLQENNQPTAHEHLLAAERLCGAQCEASSALYALRAHWLLRSGDAPSSLTKAHAALAAAKTQIDKANAQRSLGEAYLAQGQLAQAIQSAELALQMDQALGVSAKVIADLGLLARAYTQLGETQKAAFYTDLAQSATAARKQLEGS